MPDGQMTVLIVSAFAAAHEVRKWQILLQKYFDHRGAKH
jgi:hypothetical protein